MRRPELVLYLFEVLYPFPVFSKSFKPSGLILYPFDGELVIHTARLQKNAPTP